MKVKEVDGWPSQGAPERYRTSGRLTGIAFDRMKPGVLVVSVDVEGQTAFRVLRLTGTLQRSLFAVLSAHTGERVSEIGEVWVGTGKRATLTKYLVERLLRTAHKCFGFLPSFPAGTFRKPSKIAL